LYFLFTVKDRLSSCWPLGDLLRSTALFLSRRLWWLPGMHLSLTVEESGRPLRVLFLVRAWKTLPCLLLPFSTLHHQEWPCHHCGLRLFCRSGKASHIVSESLPTLAQQQFSGEQALFQYLLLSWPHFGTAYVILQGHLANPNNRNVLASEISTVAPKP
jgi:hypothetical protein